MRASGSRRHRSSPPSGSSRRARTRALQEPSAAARRRSRRRPGRCIRRCRRAAPAGRSASRCRSETALPGRGDVDVAAAGGDRDRRQLSERAARGAAEAAAEPDAAGRTGLLGEPAGGGVALQHRDGVGVLGGGIERRAVRARSRARRRPRSARPERHSPASAPPRTQAWRPPSWSSAPPVASSEKEATASASRPATYRLRPSGAIASEVAPSRPTPEAQPPPPPGRTQPAAPRSCVSAPVLASRANAVTEPEMDETA